MPTACQSDSILGLLAHLSGCRTLTQPVMVQGRSLVEGGGLRTLKMNSNMNAPGACQSDSILGVSAHLVVCRMLTPAQLPVLVQGRSMVEGGGLEGAENNVVCKHAKQLLLGQGPWVFRLSGHVQDTDTNMGASASAGGIPGG